MKKVFTENLPKKFGIGANINKLVIDLIKLKGYSVHFIYDDIEGNIKILEYDKKTRKLSIEYNDAKFNIGASDFIGGKIGRILEKKTSEFKIEIGTKFQNDKPDITIIDREYRKDKKGHNWKWYKYHCNICNWDEGWITEGNLLFGYGCSCCTGKTVIKGINDIATTHPHLVKYFKNIEDAYTHTIGSNDKVCVICPDCGFEKRMVICDMNCCKFCCTRCGDKISLPNKFAFNMLEQLNLDFKTEYNPDWCKFEFKNKLRQGYYDFYFELNNKKYILEMDGWFHNNDNKMNGQTAEESKYIDDEKDRLAQEHGIEVIRIDCCYGNIGRFKYVKNNILKDKKLNKLFDLSQIDWYKIGEFCLTSRAKEACDLWNSGIHSIKKIAEIMKLGKTTITGYLKRCQKLNKCDYVPVIYKK